VALALFLATLGTLGLVHFLALSTRRRRSDFAVMQAMGFVKRQVGASVVWQGATVAAIGVVVGVPIGIVVGRAAWNRAVSGLGMDASPTIPGPMVLALAIATFLGVGCIAALAGWFATRSRPARALRAE
jgi:ABC-type lipoprotein release transport system permease subunit